MKLGVTELRWWPRRLWFWLCLLRNAWGTAQTVYDYRWDEEWYRIHPEERPIERKVQV